MNPSVAVRSTRVLSLIVSALLALSLVGCGVQTNVTTTTPQAKKTRIGISIPSATHGWPAGVIWWAEQTRALYPDIEWDLVTAANAGDQAAQIEALLVKGLDALVVLAFDSDTPLAVIREAKNQGVFVVSVDRGLRQPVADIYLAGDNTAFGRESARYMVDKLNGQGRIVILRGIPTEIDTERYNGAMEVFNQHDGIEVLGANHGNWNRAQAHEVMQAFLQRFPRIDAVWASDDDMALGVEQALREAGRQDDMWVLGGAGMKTIVQRVMDNDPLFPADITYPPGMIAAGIHLAVAHTRDGDEQAIADNIPAHLRIDRASLRDGSEPLWTGQRTIILPVALITPENAAEFYFPDSVY